jgi:hypothetical protein
MKAGVHHAPFMVRADALVIFCPHLGTRELSPGLMALDEALGGTLGTLVADGEFDGSLDAQTTLHTFGRVPPVRILLQGLGDLGALQPHHLWRAVVAASATLERKHVSSAVFCVSEAIADIFGAEEAARLIVGGVRFVTGPIGVNAGDAPSFVPELIAERQGDTEAIAAGACRGFTESVAALREPRPLDRSADGRKRVSRIR